MNLLTSSMNKLNVFAAIAIVVGLLLAGCSRKPSATQSVLPENVIALVGETPIPTATFEVELNRQGTTDKQAVLDRLVRRELILAEAERTGFSQTPEMQEAWRSFVVNRFIESQRQRVDGLTAPTAAEVEAYYAAHADAFTKPERRQVALIYLRESGLDPEAKETLTRKANAIREEALAITNNADFGTLAARYSDHRPSRNVGGDVGWIAATGPNAAWPAEVLAGARAMNQAGEISPVIFAGQGCYLLKLITWQPAEVVPLDQVRERATYEFARERARLAEAGYYSQLQSNFPVQINLPRFDEIVVSTRQIADAKPPRLPMR